MGKDSLNKKYLWSFFHVAVFAELAIALMLVLLFVGIQTRTVRNYSIAQLEQVSTKADFLLSTLESVSHQVLADRDIFATLMATEVDRLQEFRASQRLRTIQSGYPHIRYVGFYNSVTERFQSNSCVGDREVFGPEVFYEGLAGQRYVALRRPIGVHFATQSTRSVMVYTFVFPVFLRHGFPPGLIVLDVDAAYLDTIVGNIRVDGQEQQVVFIDASGGIVAAMTAQRGDSRFMDTDPSSLSFPPFGDESFFSSGSGHLIYRGWFITYARATEMDWLVVNMVPYTHILTGLAPFLILSLLLLGVSLAFGYIISRRYSDMLYKPIGNLYERFVSAGVADEKRNELEQLGEAFSNMYAKADQLDQGLINAYNLSKHQYLNYLFEGEIDKITAQAQIYQRLNIRLDSPYYGVVVIECSPMSAPHPDSGIFISPYILERITAEVVGRFYGMEFSRIRESTFAILVYLDEGSLNTAFAKSLEEVISAMENECLVEATFCIGDVCSGWQHINISFEQAMIAIKTRPLHATGSVFHYLDEGTGTISAEQYFSGLHEKFTEYIRSNNIEACEGEFDMALRSMVNLSFEMTKTYFQHTALSVLDNFARYFDKDDASIRALLSLPQEVSAAQNVRTLRQVIIGFVTAMAHRFYAMRRTGREKTMEQVKDHIEEHFYDPALSLTVLADQVGLTSAYLGKTFSLHTGMSFNDYLARIRMVKAAEMLTDTKLTVQKISEAVGILNTNYFYSLFKKQYQMTPAQYREGKETKK